MGRLFVFLLLACVVASSVPAPATAQDTGSGSDTTQDDLGDARTFSGIVDTVEVVADRPEPLETLSTFATVHAVGETPSGITTVADVIEAGVGTHIRRYGGLGSYSTASIRASSPGQVEVYMDGAPLMSGQWGVTNLADLPLDSLESIEVYRGGAPVDFGTPGIGGLVNLVTRPAGESRSMVKLSAAGHDTWKLDLLRSGSVRGVRFLASFHHLRSEGDFEYLDRHGTPENPEDDEVVTRQNNDFSQSDLILRLTPPDWRGWRLEFANDVFTKESGVPGIENVHIQSVRYEIFRNIARATLTSPLLADLLELRTTGFHQHRRDLLFNPEDEVGFSRWDTDDLGRAYGMNGLVTVHWHAGRQAIRMFAETRRERFTPDDANPAVGEGYTRKRTSMSLSAEDKLFVGENLELVAAYRFQESVDNYTGPIPFGQPPAPRDEPHWSTFHGPTFGLRWRPHPRVTVRANRTRYSRFPSMIELFGASGTVEGNPELTPEEGTTEDFGMTWAFLPGGRGTVEAVVFRADRDDLITFLQNSQKTVKAFNLESAHVEGLELSASVSFGRAAAHPGRLDVAAAYTGQDARNTGPSPTYSDKRLPYEPEHSLFLRTAWHRGRARLWHEYRFESDAYRDRANLPENLSPARHLHDFGAAFEAIRGLMTVSAEVSNLMDDRLVDVEGYPLPGRTFTLGIEIAPEKEDRR